MTGLIVFVIVMAAAIYGMGAILAFAFASGERAVAWDRAKTHYSDVKTSPYAKERVAKARRDYIHACTMQLRAPLWPLDGARWIKAQVLTALEERGRES